MSRVYCPFQSKVNRLLPFCVGLLLQLAGFARAGDEMTIKSGAFENEHEIPIKYTCEGENLSVALEWSNLPAGTKSLVLVVDDPDAPDPKRPKLVWVHWLLYDIPPSVSSLPEGLSSADLPSGVRHGLNSWKKKAWGGPCPPIGRHRYFFKLFALDKKLGELKEPDEKKLMEAVDAHLLKKAELVGTYKKRKPKKKYPNLTP